MPMYCTILNVKGDYRIDPLTGVVIARESRLSFFDPGLEPVRFDVDEYIRRRRYVPLDILAQDIGYWRRGGREYVTACPRLRQESQAELAVRVDRFRRMRKACRPNGGELQLPGWWADSCPQLGPEWADEADRIREAVQIWQ